MLLLSAQRGGLCQNIRGFKAEVTMLCVFFLTDLLVSVILRVIPHRLVGLFAQSAQRMIVPGFYTPLQVWLMVAHVTFMQRRSGGLNAVSTVGQWDTSLKPNAGKFWLWWADFKSPLSQNYVCLFTYTQISDPTMTQKSFLKEFLGVCVSLKVHSWQTIKWCWWCHPADCC